VIFKKPNIEAEGLVDIIDCSNLQSLKVEQKSQYLHLSLYHI